jgi:hypothetical protein
MSIVAIAGTAFTYYLPGLEDQANPGLFKSSPTITASDFTMSTNGGAFGALTNTPTVSPAGGTQIAIVLSAAETTAAGAGGRITVMCQDAAGAEWYSVGLAIPVQAADVSVFKATDTVSTVTTLTNHPDTAGTTTLLTRVVGTLATGTHNPQTGDAYAVVNHATYGNAQLARTGADSDTLKTLSDQIDTVSASAIADAVLDEILSAHDIEDSLGNVLNDLTEEAAGTYRLTTAALAMAPGGGATTYSYSNTVDDGSGNLLDGVFIQCATDTGFTNIVSTATTNSLGAFTVYSDTAGTHYLRLQLAGYSFAIQTVTLA